MVPPPLSFHCTTLTPSVLFFTHFKHPPPRRLPRFSTASISNSNSNSNTNNTNPFLQPPNRNAIPQQQPRTLFPGGYKRPEIKTPTLLLHLTPEDVLNNGDGLDLVDEAVSARVGIVVLTAGKGTGKSLYEAACLVKSVVRDRAYFLIAERVDIASAVNASGVLLSDQGLPAIVARNMMVDSKSEAVFLPLVGRSVQTTSAATGISTSEGVDFLICDFDQEKDANSLVKSVFEDVKIPIFVSLASIGKSDLLNEASELIRSGASGLVVSLKDLSLFSRATLSGLFNKASLVRNETTNGLGSSNDLRLLEANKDFYVSTRVSGFVSLEDREKQLIQTERSVLAEAIHLIQKAAPMMEEVSLLVDAVNQIDEPFLLVIVVIVC